ncbi:hypothetical protein GIY23_18440 [Allosaccharopolyspora coralli]|uniref:Uncharacterized protein n=1 Tax=Allosaccharopolyspora coralli TaxID=2665642 RepID=A0A5Q3QGM4_9PSEU|nr:hypothetical protein GIY23_18440 [Allosaccharopolyspora coralli]
MDGAVTAGADTLIPLARTELYRLSEGFRRLLDEHRPDAEGRCHACPGAFRGRRWPCSVWTTAYRYLVGDHSDQANRARRSRFRTRRAHAGPTRHHTEHTGPVVAEMIVRSGDEGPSEWDTDEFELPDLATGRARPQPPMGGHLETDHTRIHRAGVVDRTAR